MRYIICSLFVFLVVSGSYSQEYLTENTFTLNGPASDSDFDDIEWLQGHWKGEAFGGKFEEIWLPPFGDTMMGAFKLVENGKTKFTELLRIIKKDGSLVIQLKHFDNEFAGWEEKSETVDFPFVKKEANKMYFDGMTFEKISNDHLTVYLAVKHKDGKMEEVKFEYFK